MFSRRGAHRGGRYGTCRSCPKSRRTETMTSARLNRRKLLQQAAIGAAALPAAGLLAPRPASAQAVELEFWTPADDPVGSKIITDLAEGFNSSVGQEKGIHVNTRIKPVTGDNYVQYTT